MRLLILVAVVSLLKDQRTSEGKEAPAAKSLSQLEVTSGTADVGGGQLYYESVSAGPAVVLIHSGGFDRRMWDDQFTAFAARHRVIRYDVRGAGKSTMARGNYRNAEDLYALLTFLHVAKAAIVGVSLGGRIALDFALAHPEATVALVLVAPGVSGYEFSEEFMDRYRMVASAARVQGAARAAQLRLDDPLFRVARKNPALHRRLLEIAQDNGDSWQTGTLAASQPPALDRLASIHAPTLVVVGSEDIPEIQQLADTIARGVPKARKAVVRDADHALNMEKPAEFNRIVLEFLGGASTR